MTPKRIAIAYLSTAVVFIVLDSVWLTTMADRLYRPALGHLVLETFDPLPAALFYLLYWAGVVFFAVAPTLSSGRVMAAIGRGALLGLTAYATYDLTNQSTLRDWPWRVTLADMSWGPVVTGVAAGAASWITQRLTQPSGR